MVGSPSASIDGKKTTLLRVLREKSVELYPEAQASLDLMPEGFLDWRDQYLTPPG